MQGIHPAGPMIGGLIALICLWFSLRQRRRQRLLADLPTSKVHGVFIGLVELKGTAESEAPLTSYLAGARCVHYGWTVEEHWRRTTTESYTDSKGKRKTRTKTTTGWDTVARGGDQQAFYLKDDTGVIRVRPEGAKLDPAGMFAQTVTRGHGLYHGKGPATSVRGSTGTRRFTERGIRLHAPLFVVGTARERAEVVAPEIVAEKGAAEFLISTRSEEAVTRGLGWGSWASWAVGLVALPVGMLVAAGQAGVGPQVTGWVVMSVVFYLIGWGLGWVWMVHDGIIGLRERVRQGWSLIDVQLKRRHDLLPGLNQAVAGLAGHEQDVQKVLAELRTQGQATKPGAAGPEVDGVAGVLLAVVEKYPELKAREGFLALQRELVCTEQRIALARAYYNDIATHYATRLEIVPDRFVARLRKLTPEPLLAAAHFERAPVVVNFAD